MATNFSKQAFLSIGCQDREGAGAAGPEGWKAGAVVMRGKLWASVYSYTRDNQLYFVSFTEGRAIASFI